VAFAGPIPSIAEFLRLLSDPVRWMLLQELTRSDRRVNELTQLAGKPQNLVSYHLRELRDAGVVSTRRSSSDGRDIYYRVDLDRCGQLLGAAGSALHPALRLEVRPNVIGELTAGRPRKVLFLCTGNSARSQMAEALLTQASEGAIDAASAGSNPKPVHPNAVRAMRTRGIDISANRSKHLDEFVSQPFDAVITLCDRVREVCPEFPSDPELVHWSLPDPSLASETNRGSYAAFERTAAELWTRIHFQLHLITTNTDTRRYPNVQR
jgi:ArsR family transcriptional regulator, arsenate/arsenite/antimonite-responsive transcriptional repressor / arsenate reductase (thioredoxin)